MKTIQQGVVAMRTTAKILAVFLILFLSCTENQDADTPHYSAAFQQSVAEQKGQQFYDHISQHALEDPLKNIPESDQAILKTEFDKLKASGNVNAKAILDDAVLKGKMRQATHDALLQFDQALVEYVQQNPDIDLALRWCQHEDEKIKSRTDLTDTEKIHVLSHQAILRNYIKFTLESLPTSDTPSARIESGKSILCYVGCTVNNIASFSAVGGLAGPEGELIGAGVGLIFTLVNSSGCNCSTPATCGVVTSISSPDVCYSALQGKTFTAWGYGVLPMQFEWDFYREDLSNAPIVRISDTDQYTLTNTELNGASKVAARVISNCSGILYYSKYLWFAPQDAGKPRPVIIVYEYGNNQVRYDVSGANNQTYRWGYIMPYRGTIVAGGGTTSSITVQWASAGQRIGVSVTTTSPCGTATAVAP